MAVVLHVIKSAPNYLLIHHPDVPKVLVLFGSRYKPKETHKNYEAMY